MSKKRCSRWEGMVNGEDWDEEDIGRKFANSPTVQPNYTVFNTGLEGLGPSFGEGIKILSNALEILRRLLAAMVSVFADLLPGRFIPETLNVQWRYLCNKKLLGSEIRRVFKTYLTSEEKIEKENLTFAYIQIRSKVNYVVDKHNAKISRDRVQASTNAKKKSGDKSDYYKNGDDKCFKSGDEDEEISAGDDSDEETGEGKISSRMPDSSIRSYQSQK